MLVGAALQGLTAVKERVGVIPVGARFGNDDDGAWW